MWYRKKQETRIKKRSGNRQEKSGKSQEKPFWKLCGNPDKHYYWSAFTYSAQKKKKTYWYIISVYLSASMRIILWWLNFDRHMADKERYAYKTRWFCGRLPRQQICGCRWIRYANANSKACIQYQALLSNVIFLTSFDYFDF